MSYFGAFLSGITGAQDVVQSSWRDDLSKKYANINDPIFIRLRELDALYVKAEGIFSKTKAVFNENLASKTQTFITATQSKISQLE